jgi:hypothetical protein
MTLVEALAQCASGEGLTDGGGNPCVKLGGMEFLKLNEFNYSADNLQGYDWPLILVVPFEDTRGPKKSGAWTSTAPLTGWILFKADEAVVNQYTTLQLEEIIAHAKTLGDTFFRRLINHDVMDPDFDPSTFRVKYTPTYGMFDVYCHGVAFSTTIQFKETTSVCLN